MQSVEIREKFLSFFEGKGHRRVASSPLIPAQDPTLLFTNAGMVQFKDCFLGLEDPGYRRATTAQKCVRAGGKHNDLENVGFTPRHHTFFEMLGNFSFGDYFKKDAIGFAWELLTQTYNLPKDRLRITVFKDDDEAAKIWESVGVRQDWIVRLGEKDNFWAMGDTGPCGPCTEIHFDWGESRGCKRPTCAPGCECDTRFLEIWNLVFMQFNRNSDGKLTPLPRPSVDTGAGLERLAAVLQGVYSNYDTDLFQPLIQAVSHQVGKKYEDPFAVSMRVIADHLRAGTFLLTDAVVPSNEGRGYVLRRILRRAIRHGKKLGQDSPFLYRLVPDVISILGKSYPEIAERRSNIQAVMKEEEERFHQTLHRGVGLLEESLARLSTPRILPGEVVFKLYDTFGFPLDLIQVICTENSVAMDEAGFQGLMEKQRIQSSWVGSQPGDVQTALSKSLEGGRLETEFVGYEKLKISSAVIRVWDALGHEIDTIDSAGFAAFDQTPFYSESGGQIGDRGQFSGDGFSGRITTTRRVGSLPIHTIQMESGKLSVRSKIVLEVDGFARKATAINHTATHLLHAALRSVLGDRVKQAGSHVDSERLRFDFSFSRAVTPDELEKVQNLINAQIERALAVSTSVMSHDKAMKSGALAFFDEKYGETVRVVRIGYGEESFSVELCGGTHISNVFDIIVFKVLSESSVSSGVRRIEAITARTAIQRFAERDRQLSEIEFRLGARGTDAVTRLATMESEIKASKKEIERLKLAAAQGGVGTAPWDKKEMVRDLQLVMEIIPGANATMLRTLSDQIRDKLRERVVVVLATEAGGKVTVCVGISKDLTARLSANRMAKELASDLGGAGGGKIDFAQAGGNRPEAIGSAFSRLRQTLQTQDLR